MAFGNGVKNMQAVAYNGARTVVLASVTSKKTSAASEAANKFEKWKFSE